ncbi:MAG: ATP-binding cassette domain-containing protein [Dehalococcoidia bacterium]|nr:ATP-binding cassette domain-containing protein [Dehalococcoidia bacterium]
MSLELRSISHRYTNASGPVLRNVSLRIEPGRVEAIIGPSGSGKTTLLSILGLLTRPSEGTVLLDGVPAPRAAGALAAIRAERYGWIFQTVNILNRRTVLDNASLGLLARGASLRETHAAARDSLTAVGLGGMLDRPANSLSGGELQRLCVARAIAARPRYLLADEPTGQLDRSTTAEVIDAIVRVRTPGTAIVIVTHDPLVAARCDRIWEINDGQILDRASEAELAR